MSAAMESNGNLSLFCAALKDRLLGVCSAALMAILIGWPIHTWLMS